jgi:acyl-CoA thioester hydrolase
MPRVFLKEIKVGEDAIDVHRHVNNQEYLRWMQEIAIDHSTAQGWPMERYLQTGKSWYVRSHFIEYLRPAGLGDELTICTWVGGMGERSSPRRTLFLRGSDRQILARAETQWIYIDLRSGRPLPIAEEMRTAFDVVESEAEILREIGWGQTALNPGE